LYAHAAVLVGKLRDHCGESDTKIHLVAATFSPKSPIPSIKISWNRRAPFLVSGILNQKVSRDRAEFNITTSGALILSGEIKS
jgi:hypothetical protein